MTKFKPMDLPPLLSAKHIMAICDCSRPKAYQIMYEPHRPIWRNGGIVRLHRDMFLEQLKNESTIQYSEMSAI